MEMILFLLLGLASLHMFVLTGQPIPGFISIDCGATNDYTDKSNSIYYETDVGYADTGTNKQVSTDNFGDAQDARAKNLRIFPDGTRNCYTLRPLQGKDNKYLIRASFFYGNYDNLNMTPVFDVHIDTNFWFTYSWDGYFCKEIIYVLSRNYVQVCLINTGKGVPYISSVELRLLDKDIYPFDSGALVMSRRYAFGLSAASIRYPKDTFDRIWYQHLFRDTQAVTNTTAIEINPNDNTYKVPIAVVETAQVWNDSQAFYLTKASNLNDCWYFYLHFSEIQVLSLNQSREFSVYINNELVTTENPKYSTLIIARSQILTDQIIVDFNLVPTARSTLSPIINALEIYEPLKLPNPMTYTGDFDAINNISGMYGLAKIKESWQGDPCSPTNFMWSALSCSNDSVPRIISLNLSSSGLTGSITPALADLMALESLDLSNNQLTGQVPDFLAQMQSLKIINLSGNKLNGSVPPALMMKVADGTLQLSLEGNPNLCNSSYCPTTGRLTENERGIIVPIVTSTLTVVLVVSLVTITVIWRCAGKKNGRSRAGTLKIFTHSELEGITNNFRTIIGEGSFGKVYLGSLEDGSQVAVKVLSRTSRQGRKEFQAEVKLLIAVYHRNLVTLAGYCDDPKSMALVYEYMSNGDVREHLSRRELPILSWPQRLQIAVDAAQGLEYLHSGCKPPIMHRDLKTANILLDVNMEAKIADFGLSRAFKSDYDTHISTDPAGTLGYVDPEYQSSGTFNQKSDVYSFGIILFELITGHQTFTKDGDKNTHILHRVTPLIEKGDIERIVDPKLRGKFQVSSAWKAVEVAMSCVLATAVQRPDMGLVLSELKECMTLEIAGTHGPGTHGPRMGTLNRCYSIEMCSLDAS